MYLGLKIFTKNTGQKLRKGHTENFTKSCNASIILHPSNVCLRKRKTMFILEIRKDRSSRKPKTYSIINS